MDFKDGQKMVYPPILALGLIFLILGYTQGYDSLVVVGLVFGAVGLLNTLPQIRENLAQYKDKDHWK